jgi:hypothetical protein
MTLTTDIATHLQTDSIGTIGATTDWAIYENNMPASPDKCIAVFAYGGSPPDLSWEGEYPSVQVRVRGGAHEVSTTTGRAVHTTTYDKAYAVMKSLHETTRTTINSTVYYWIAAKHSPMSLGRDSKGRDIYVINFDVMKELE